MPEAVRDGAMDFCRFGGRGGRGFEVTIRVGGRVFEVAIRAGVQEQLEVVGQIRIRV